MHHGCLLHVFVHYRRTIQNPQMNFSILAHTLASDSFHVHYNEILQMNKKKINGSNRFRLEALWDKISILLLLLSDSVF